MDPAELRLDSLESAAIGVARLDERLRTIGAEGRATWLASAAFAEGAAIAGLDGFPVDPLRILRWIRHDIGGHVRDSVACSVAESAMTAVRRLDTLPWPPDPSRIREILSVGDGLLGMIPSVETWLASLPPPASPLVAWSFEAARLWIASGGGPLTARLILRSLMKGARLASHPPFAADISVEGIAAGATRGLDRLVRLNHLRQQLLKAMEPRRVSSRAPRIVEFVLREPMFGVRHLAADVDMSRPRAFGAVQRLVDLGLLTEVTGRTSSRLYVCARVLTC